MIGCHLQSTGPSLDADEKILTHFSPPDHETGVIEELLLILSTDHLTHNNQSEPDIHLTEVMGEKEEEEEEEEEEGRRGAGGVPDTDGGME